MTNSRRPFRLNVGFLLNQPVGYSHEFPFSFDQIQISPDLDLRHFEGVVTMGRTPQGLIVQGDFTAETTLSCVRCLNGFWQEIHFGLTELYAFKKKDMSESGLLLPELLHTATLVHDDLIDGSLLRRGNPTLNAKWSPAATVLTGDFLFARAACLAAQTDNVQLMNHFAQTLAIIVNGELTQMFAARGLISLENYCHRIYAKTASLFEMSARAAAMISPVDEATVETMRDFGYQVGMAFQIVDDILDFTGEQASVGKPVGSDLLNGLVTLPAIFYAKAHPDDPNVRRLNQANGYADRPAMEALAQSIGASDAIPQAMDKARDFVAHAVARLEPFHPGTERAALEDLAHYIVDRNI